MPYPAPSLEDLVRSQETLFENALGRWAEANGQAASSEALARAVRSPRGLIAAMARNNAAHLWASHQHVASLYRQVLPGTADVDFLIEHAATWGIFRRPPTRAIGRVVLAGTPGLAVPAGLEMRAPSGAVLAIAEAGTIGADGTGRLDVRALEPGPDGNVAAGSTLPLIASLAGLDPQSAIVDEDGVVGGALLETPASLLDRLLQRIRRPPAGGAARDYVAWVQNEFAAAHVGVLSGIYGPGSVTVVVAMGPRTTPRAPTPAEIAAISALLGRLNVPEGNRPVTASAYVVAAALRPVSLSLRVSPDTAGVRAAIEAAFAAFFAREARIAEPVYFSRLSEAISAAEGEYRHVLFLPSRDVAMGPIELPVPGPVEWVA